MKNPLFAIGITEMGLNPLIKLLILVFGLFFIVSFIFTSPNIDSKGLLRVLYAKPMRKEDGTVEYREDQEQ
tara:strand:- start:1446 stop:1658 length:213 start_codon:yes stop_codon:yes gene_type:complete